MIDTYSNGKRPETQVNWAHAIQQADHHNTVCNPGGDENQVALLALPLVRACVRLRVSYLAMDTSNSTRIVACAKGFTGNFAIVLLFMALPFHFLTIKVLAFNLRFASSRHIILLCLSVSDCLQVLINCICIVSLKIANLTTESSTCKVIRSTIAFNAALTLIVSSLSLMALSIERYIACFYSYRIHELLTNKRIVGSSIVFWILGFSVGPVAAIPKESGAEEAILIGSAYLGHIVVGTVLPVSALLVIIQLKLFFLSRKKMTRVVPSMQSEVERKSIFKRQFRVALIASMVILSYIACLLPGACFVILNEFLKMAVPKFSLQMLSIALGMANALLNPFIYGFGMLDTRQAIKRELKRMKNYVLEKIGFYQDIW